MAQSPLDILNAAGIDSLGRGQSEQQQPMQQAPQGGLPPIKPSSSQTKSILESEIERLTGEEDELGSLKQLADERKREREKLQKFYEEFQPSDAEKFLAIGQGLGQRVPRGGGQSSIAASVANAAGLVAPVVSKQEQLKQAYRLKAMEMGYAAADEAYKESMTQKRDIQKLLMQEQIRSKGADGMSSVGKAVRDFDPTLQPGTPEYQAVFDRFANFMYGNAAGKAIASGDPRVISLTTNPQYIQEKKAIEDEFDNASTRAAYGPTGAKQWQIDRQAKLDALQQRYIGMGAGASNLVPGAPRAEPSAPGIIPPPSPMNQAPSAPNVVPSAGVSSAVQQAESGGNTRAVSPKGAQGSMQLMPGTAKDLGVDPTNPVENAAGGEKYLSGLRAKYGNDVYALAAYNWGPGNVDKWVKEGANLDKLPTETKNYIDRVRKLAGPNFVELNAAGAPAPAPSATVQTATAPSVAPSLTTTAKPGARPFITPAQEEVAKESAKMEAKRDFTMGGLGDAIDGARKLLSKNPTASGGGKVVDAVGNFLGISSESADTAAALKAVGGALVSKMPRMEGPQSDYDVQNYKEMAAQVGDASIPVSQRLIALKEVERLWRKYDKTAGTTPAASKTTTSENIDPAGIRHLLPKKGANK